MIIDEKKFKDMMIKLVGFNFMFGMEKILKECEVNVDQLVIQQKLEEATNLLKEILPMQGCITCQELYTYCDAHGDIRKTTKRIEKFLSI